jgi:hypothetical protein
MNLSEVIMTFVVLSKESLELAMLQNDKEALDRLILDSQKKLATEHLRLIDLMRRHSITVEKMEAICKARK